MLSRACTRIPSIMAWSVVLARVGVLSLSAARSLLRSVSSSAGVVRSGCSSSLRVASSLARVSSALACSLRLAMRGAQVLLWHGARLERTEVTVHRGARLRELVLYAGKLGLLLLVDPGRALVRLGDRTVEQLVVIEHLPQATGDGLAQAARPVAGRSRTAWCRSAPW